MKRREQETLKALSVPELESEIRKRKDEMLRFEVSKSFRKEKNPLRQRILRREIARLKTWVRSKPRAEA
ncbi:MAG: 50S ribosomal protein L29 [Elusimicrobia bacterium]|nr:50S ribosomal protein L29 [Elusimicrobiota bacterium]